MSIRQHSYPNHRDTQSHHHVKVSAKVGDVLEEEPVDWCNLDTMTKQDKQKYLDDLSDKVVTALWRDLKVENILSADEENAYLYCICEEDKESSMIECSEVHCDRGKWFHLDCVPLQDDDVPDGDWFCSKKCAISIRAVKVTGISGWLPHRLQQDLVWNRTVNLSGGPGRNLEIDLVNEMLNKDFKESLRAAGGTITDETVARHSQLVGYLGQKIEKMFGKISRVEEKNSVKTVKSDIEKDLKMFISVISKENLFDVIPGRQFKAFPQFHYEATCKDPMRLKKKMKQLSKRLDRLKRIIN